jgi:ankyrin repeat protein
MTPLALAVANGYVHIAATLLRADANPNASDRAGRCPLDFALSRGDWRAMKLLLNYGADPNVHNATSSLVSKAVKNRQIEAIKILIEHHALLNGLLEPPLGIAIQTAYAEAVQVLMASGASIFDQFQGGTILQFAERQKSPLLQLLTQSLI